MPATFERKPRHNASRRTVFAATLWAIPLSVCGFDQDQETAGLEKVTEEFAPAKPTKTALKAQIGPAALAPASGSHPLLN
jgi:hypothetical protein